MDAHSLGPVTPLSAEHAEASLTLVERIGSALDAATPPDGGDAMAVDGVELRLPTGATISTSADPDDEHMSIALRSPTRNHDVLVELALLDALGDAGPRGTRDPVEQIRRVLDLATSVARRAAFEEDDEPTEPTDLQHRADVALATDGTPRIAIAHAIGTDPGAPLVPSWTEGVAADDPYAVAARTPRLRVDLTDDAGWTALWITSLRFSAGGRDRGPVGTLRLLGGRPS